MSSVEKNAVAPVRPLPRAILFDMDGTLTEPMLDFALIRAEMRISGPILEAMEMLQGTRRTQAEEILLRHEQHAAENSSLNAGCHDLLAFLASRGVSTALVTRNSRLSASTVIRRHQLPIDLVITREDGPFKPDPFPLDLACRRLGLGSSDVWMVGDGQYDIEAAHAAGISSVWISHRKPRPFEAQPWLTVADLPELMALLNSYSG